MKLLPIAEFEIRRTKHKTKQKNLIVHKSQTYFTECQTTVPNLKVVSIASSYKDTGTFKCEDGYEMKQLQNNFNSLNTECLKNAKWGDEYLFECWGGILISIFHSS